VDFAPVHNVVAIVGTKTQPALWTYTALRGVRPAARALNAEISDSSNRIDESPQSFTLEIQLIGSLMGSAVPIELNRLLQATELPDREAAWERLIARHTRLILSAARSLGGDNDAVMERYAYVLGKLRENEFRRLRAFDSNAGATFSTWLTVTARRMCLDLHRSKFGRQRQEHSNDKTSILRAARKALGGSFFSDVDADTISVEHHVDVQIIREQRNECLRDALSRLTPRERLLLTLRFEDDLSAQRIAAVMGLPSPFHVYRRLNSILVSLRQRLISNGIENSDG
jgi:RNA polymerase sigma factor (sigma-70 family)